MKIKNINKLSFWVTIITYIIAISALTYLLILDELSKNNEINIYTIGLGILGGSAIWAIYGFFKLMLHCIIYDFTKFKLKNISFSINSKIVDVDFPIVNNTDLKEVELDYENNNGLANYSNNVVYNEIEKTLSAKSIDTLNQNGLPSLINDSYNLLFEDSKQVYRETFVIYDINNFKCRDFVYKGFHLFIPFMWLFKTNEVKRRKFKISLIHSINYNGEINSTYIDLEGLLFDLFNFIDNSKTTYKVLNGLKFSDLLVNNSLGNDKDYCDVYKQYEDILNRNININNDNNVGRNIKKLTNKVNNINKRFKERVKNLDWFD